ncbi:MAG: FAD-dependent oxidoreductase [Hyphomicrobium sp.]|nr:FAD-dependent oxidoreductase [Hyphomicrobium sp.]
MEHRVQACIAGGGPAGLMLGVLLARAGIRVMVLEKHGDFLRDFRGDTIHPSTMQVLHELGWLDEFLTLPHVEIRQMRAQFGDTLIQLADLSHLPVKAPFIAMMPQWDFLNFLAAKGKTYPGFKLVMNAEARGLIVEDDRVTGITAQTANGPMNVRAELVVAADGRTSTLRKAANLESENFGAPMDVLWFSLPRAAGDPDGAQARFDGGRIFVMFNRGDYWQCAFVIQKGAEQVVRAQGLAAFKRTVAALVPFGASRVEAIASLDDVKLLSVQVDRLIKWSRPGLLCIGDAAHAMSPLGGVGINLAIQDAVATSNLLAAPLRDGTLMDGDLEAVQKRRDFPTRATQRLQVVMQNTIIAPTLSAKGQIKPPLAIRLMTSVPLLSRIPARILGLGFRPEHVASS